MCAVTAALGIGVVAAAVTSPGHKPSTHPESSATVRTASSGPTPIAGPSQQARPAGSLILHNGETARASGEVMAKAGKPTLFCPPFGQPLDLIGRSPYPCPAAVVVNGVDLSKLTRRFEEQGVTIGGATLTGIYRNNTLTVTTQGPATPATFQDLTNPPCPAPAGGWSPGGATRYAPAYAAYVTAHPGLVILGAYYSPSPGRHVFFILVDGDPVPVRAKLAQAWGKDQCVVRSRFTREQIAAAYRIIGSQHGSIQNTAYMYGETLLPTGQITVDADVPILTASFVAALSAQPSGLITTKAWLVPVG